MALDNNILHPIRAIRIQHLMYNFAITIDILLRYLSSYAPSVTPLTSLYLLLNTTAIARSSFFFFLIFSLLPLSWEVKVSISTTVLQFPCIPLDHAV